MGIPPTAKTINSWREQFRIRCELAEQTVDKLKVNWCHIPLKLKTANVIDPFPPNGTWADLEAL